MAGENDLIRLWFTPFELPLKKCAVFLALKDLSAQISFENKGGTTCDRRPLMSVVFYMEKEGGKENERF